VDLDAFDVHDAIKACISEMRYANGENGSDPVKETITAEDFRSGFKAILKN
jgi:hypothetical protein